MGNENSQKNIKSFWVEQLKYIRKKHNLSQEEVATFLGTSQTMYARYERGANELPIRHLIKLCELYQVSSDTLLGLKYK